MTDAKMTDERLVLHGSFTSCSTYKPMLFLALSGLPVSFRTVNLKNGVQKQPEHLAINRYGRSASVAPSRPHPRDVNRHPRLPGAHDARFEAATEQDRWRAREWLSWENDAITSVARVRHFGRFRTVDPAS